jgi:hypothetical protein
MKIAIIDHEYESGDYIRYVTEHESVESFKNEIFNIPEVIEFLKLEKEYEILIDRTQKQEKEYWNKRWELMDNKKLIYRNHTLPEVLEILDMQFISLEQYLETIKW